MKAVEFEGEMVKEVAAVELKVSFVKRACLRMGLFGAHFFWRPLPFPSSLW